MHLVDAAGVVVLVLFVALAALVVRRAVLRRGNGAVDCSLRLRSRARGRGWAVGVGRYDGDTLRWYRVFSAAPWPRRTLRRADLVVAGQRSPVGGEALALSSGVVVLECRAVDDVVELAMTEGVLTGFLAWLESAPPGAYLPRLI